MTSESRPSELALLSQLDREIAQRSIRSTRLPVIEYTPSSPIPDSQLAPTGTIGVFVARRGSRWPDRIRAAAEKPGRGDDRGLAREIIRRFRTGTPRPFADAVRMMAAQPVLAHLNYAGSTMVQYLFAEDEDSLYVTVLPYAGGPLVEDGFRLDEYLYDDDDAPLECVLVKNDPILTDAERAAIRKVPPDLVHAFVSPLDTHACGPAAAVALHLLVWGFVYATFTAVKALDDKSMEHINPQAVDSLGPIAAVRMLLRMRIDILKGELGAGKQQTRF